MSLSQGLKLLVNLILLTRSRNVSRPPESTFRLMTSFLSWVIASIGIFLLFFGGDGVAIVKRTPGVTYPVGTASC